MAEGQPHHDALISEFVALAGVTPQVVISCATFPLSESSKLILYNKRLKDTSKIVRGSWDLQSPNISTALRQ